MVGKWVGNIEKIRVYMKVCINFGFLWIGNVDWKFGEIIESGDRYCLNCYVDGWIVRNFFLKFIWI